MGYDVRYECSLFTHDATIEAVYYHDRDQPISVPFRLTGPQ